MLKNPWKSRGLSFYGKVNIIKAILLPNMTYPSSVLCTPPIFIQEFNTLVFHFLSNARDKITRRSKYAPYESSGLKMIRYEEMVKALRLRWLKRVIGVDYTCFWKLYLNDLLRELGGLFLLQCNYDINQINIASTFYYELLQWWSDLRETANSDSGYKYIIRNNKENLIEGRSILSRHYCDNNIMYTKDFLFEKTNIESFNTVKGKGLVKRIFLVWTGLRKAVPLDL